MSDADFVSRQLALLKKLEGRGVRTGASLPEREAGASGRKAKGSPAALDKLFPEAEKLDETPGGAAAWRLRTRAWIDGTCTRAGYTCPAEAWHGMPDAAALGAVAGDAQAWAGLAPEKILYIDTETTGLATGAGTYAFLVGVGWFEAPGAFVLDQYFMDDFEAEPLMLAALDEVFGAAEAIVSYNGRSYDLPLLTARWVMNRLRPRFPERHLDLLTFARRLWRRVLPDCSLGTVEHHVLRHTRTSDVPGMMIPRIYHDALRGARPERLTPVFDHHAQDILSLGALASLASCALERPEDPRLAAAEVQWGLARVYEHQGRREEALLRLEAAVLGARDESFGYQLAMQLARVYKRQGRGQDAADLWQARVGQCRPGRLEPLVELAKWAEHTQKDPAAAMRWTQQALDVLGAQQQVFEALGSERPPRWQQEHAALAHRLERNRRKLER